MGAVCSSNNAGASAPSPKEATPPVVTRDGPKQPSKEERRAKVQQLRAGMQKNLDLLQKCKEANKENMAGGLLDTPLLSKLDELMPYIMMAADIAAEAAIPPPGGHCVHIALKVAHRVIKELASNQLMMAMAESCVQHMLLAMDDEKIEALDHDEGVRNAFNKYKDCISDIQKFIDQAAGQDSFWLKRLLLLPKTEEQLLQYDKELEEAAKFLKLGLSIGSYSILSAGKRAKEDVTNEVNELFSKYPGCRSISDLTKHPEAQQELAAIMGNLGTFEKATLTAINNVVDSKGAHTIVRNRALKKLWTQSFSYLESVKWHSFWGEFPAKLTEEKEELTRYFQDEQKRKLFQLAVDRDDPSTVDVTEINLFFDEKTRLQDRVNAKMNEYIANQGAENQVSEKLKEIPEDVTRPDQPLIMELLQSKRLVVIQGIAGEGKYIAACQAGQALFKPAKNEDNEKRDAANLPGYFQAIYSADLNGVDSEDSLDNRFHTCFQKIPRDGASKDQIQAALSTLFLMDTADHPYQVLLILNHAEEIPDGYVFDQFCNRLKGILYKGSDKNQPSNFTVVLSSRSNRSELANKLFGQYPETRDDGVSEVDDLYADYKLKPLEVESAAKILLAEVQRLGKKVQVSDEDAQKLADTHARNPQLLKLLGGSLKSENHLKLALKTPYRQAVQGAFNDMLFSCLEKLGPRALGTLMVIVDSLPLVFDEGVLQKVLVGWYETDDEIERLADMQDDLEVMMQHNTVQILNSVYSVVPLIRDFIRHVIANPPQNNTTLSSQIERVVNARPQISRNNVAYALELLDNMFKTSLHAYKSTYRELCAYKPYVQSALLKVKDHEFLYKDDNMLQKVLQILSYMVYNPLLFDMEKVQDACISLAEKHAGNQDVLSKLLSAASAFFRFGLDERHGHEASLKRAEQAIALSRDTSEAGVIAKAVALRNKGLILRDLYRHLDVAIKCHEEAVNLLQGFPDSKMAQLETILNLAEMSGTMDYEKRYEEGVRAANKGMDLAHKLFGSEGNHPVTALAHGALGFNLRGSGDFKGALDVHKQAYQMRHFVCGLNHQETAVSLQQMGLCLWDLDQIQEAEESLKKSLEVRVKLERTPRMVNLIANSLDNLAQLYLSTCGDDAARKEEAVNYYKKTIDTRLTILKPDNKKIKEPCAKLVELLSSMGRTEEAQGYQAKCEVS